MYLLAWDRDRFPRIALVLAELPVLQRWLSSCSYPTPFASNSEEVSYPGSVAVTLWLTVPAFLLKLHA